MNGLRFLHLAEFSSIYVLQITDLLLWKHISSASIFFFFNSLVCMN